MKPNKDTIFFIFVTLIMGVMVWFGLRQAFDRGVVLGDNVTYPRARVLEVSYDQTAVDIHGVRRGRQDIVAQILTGPHRGKIVQAHNIIFINDIVNARPGQRLVLFFEYDATHSTYFARVHTYDRATAMYALVLLFFGLLVAVGGKAGLRSAFGLVFTFVTILCLLIPAIAMGAPPAITTLVLSLVIIVVSLIAIMGFAKKTYVAIAGTAIGIVLCCLFYLIIAYFLNVTGFSLPEMNTLVNIGFAANTRIAELLFCGILIASLGAVMDTAVSVASATAELAQGGKSDFKNLFTKSMRIARDCIGSSANTIILAFTGAYFVTLVLFRLNNFDYHMAINRVDIAIEVLRAISASAALVLCAPATAIIGSRVYCTNLNRRKLK